MYSIALLLALSAPTPVPSPQDSKAPAMTEVGAPAPALSIEWAGLDRALLDPRDAGLLAALQLADERLLQLTALPDWDGPPAEVMTYAFDLLGSAFTLSIGVDPEAGEIPVSAHLEVHGSADHVQDLSDRLLKLMGMQDNEKGQPDAAHPGLFLMETPVGVLGHGVPTQGPPRFVVTFGNAPEATAIAQTAKGSRVFAVEFDMQPFQPLIKMGLEQAGPEAEPMLRMLEKMGLLGDNPMRLAMEVAHAEGQAFIATRLHGLMGIFEAFGIPEPLPLPASVLKQIPMGATYAQVMRSEPTGMIQSLDMILPPEIQQQGNPLDMFREATGLDLATDFLEPLGDMAGFYLAPETGGGFLSATLFNSVDDPETLANAIASLGEFVAGPLSEELEGHARIEAWQPSGLPSAHGWRLVFPQLPIPVEPALLISNGWMYVSLFPSSTLTAAQQGLGSGTSILDSPVFQEAFSAANAQAFVSLQYSDTHAQLKQAYSFVRLFGKAIDNALLLPDGPSTSERMPVVPPYDALVNQAKPTLILGYWDGEVLVSEGSMDASLIANCGGIAGSYLMLVTGIGVASALATPMLMNSMDGSMMPVAQATPANPVDWEPASQLVAALESYQANNNGVWPTSAEVLLQPRASGEPYLSALPTDTWGRPFVYIAPADENSWPSVMSYGADGVEGGFGENEDVYYY